MANHKSAIKRAKQNITRRMRNKDVKTKVKSTVKNVELAAGNASDKVLNTLDTAKSVIDKAVKKGAIHKKTAARKISRLSKLANKAAA